MTECEHPLLINGKDQIYSSRKSLNLFNDEKIDSDVEFPVVLVTPNTSSQSRFIRNNNYKYTRYKQYDSRYISKRGKTNTYLRKIPHKYLRYGKNFWNTLTDTQWRWITLMVALVNLAGYLSCALLFYLDSVSSGDFQSEAAKDNPCLKNSDGSFIAIFMLAIETITTAGYGYIYPTEFCNFYYIVLAYSTLLNIVIDGAFISIVYSKMIKSKDKASHIFSRKAVIALRNGKLCLIIRINDDKGKHWIDSNINLYLVKEETSTEQEQMSNFVHELKIQPHGMLFWPIDVVHEIDSKSPLWDMSARDIMTTKLEIIVVTTGSSVQTGRLTRSQTSYINKEIMWGYSFSSWLMYDTDTKEYLVDRTGFNNTVLREVPLCSAKVLSTLQRKSGMRRKSMDFGDTALRKVERNSYIFGRTLYKFNEI